MSQKAKLEEGIYLRALEIPLLSLELLKFFEEYDISKCSSLFLDRILMVQVITILKKEFIEQLCGVILNNF